MFTKKIPSKKNDDDESGIWHYGVTGTSGKQKRPMTQDEILRALQAEVDAHTALTLRVSRLDPLLGDALHEQGMLWRSLVLRATNMTLDGLDNLKKYQEQKGE